MKLGVALKLKFVSIARFVLRFVLMLALFAFVFLFDDVSFCKNQNSPAPKPKTTTVPRMVKMTVFGVFDGGVGGG